MVASTTSVVSNKTVGSILPGTEIPVATTLQEFIELMVTATFEPTFIAPSATLDKNIASSVEVGTQASLTLTASLNRGSIKGTADDPDPGVWNIDGIQDFRSGEATNYTFKGALFNNTPVVNGTDPVYAKGMVTIPAGTNTFEVDVTYAAGPQPTNSKGDNFSSALPSNTTPLNSSTTVVGQRKYFYGVDHDSATSADVRGLANGVLNPANGTSFTINIPLGATSVVFAYPDTDTLRDVSTVKYVEGLNAEVKGIFTKTSVNVEGANAYTAIGYKVYRYVPNAPFPNAATYVVTI